jgi:hypothetical protein
VPAGDTTDSEASRHKQNELSPSRLATQAGQSSDELTGFSAPC